MSLFLLLRRQFRHYRGPSILLAVIVLVVSGILTMWPRAIDAMYAQDLRQTLGSASGSQRDLIGYLSAPPPLTDLDANFDGTNPGATTQLATTLERIRDDLPQPLRGMAGDARWKVTGFESVILGPFPTGIFSVDLNYAADPMILEHIELRSGSLPGPLSLDDPGTEPLEILLSSDSAAAAGWEVGEERPGAVLRSFNDVVAPPDRPVLLAGTYGPRDAADPYWTINTDLLTAVEEVNPNTGTLVTATAVVSPDAFAPTFAMTERTQTTMWLPLDGSGLEASVAPLVEAQLRQAVGTPHAIPSTSPNQTAQFNSGAPDLIAESTQRAASTNQILALLASGPLGVCLATAAVAVRLVVDRRRSAVELAGARGASASQLRSILGVEGLVIGIPAAVLGALLAAVAIPVPFNPLHFAWAVVAALVPAVLLALPHPAPAVTGTGGGSTEATRRRWRLAVEAFVVGLAATSTILMFQRGIDQQVLDLGAVDPLLSATPLLIALAACVLVLRLYPLPLAWYAKRQQGAPGLIGYLGAVRALRSPGGGLLPVLALIVGLAVVVFAGVLLSTFRAGVTDAAQYDVGADLRIQGSPLSAEAVERIQELEGVENIAGVTDLGQLRVRDSAAGENSLVRVLAIDPAEVRTAQQGSAGAFPSGLLELLERPAAGGTLPVLMSSAVGLTPGSSGTLSYRNAARPIDIVGTGPEQTTLATGSNWLLVSTTAVNALDERTFEPSVVFLDLDPAADGTMMREAIAGVVPTPLLIQTPTEFEDLTLRSPSGAGLQAGLWTVIVFMGVLCALTIVMTSVVNAPARNRLLALLRTLGFPRQRDGALILWELGPIAAGALFTGTLLGFMLPLLILDNIDLAAFTGGGPQPGITVDITLTVGLLAGFLAVTASSIAAAVAVGRRQRVATVLRMTDSH